MYTMVRSFNELTTDQLRLAGGKGSALARLYQAGYPVPDGFVILPEAFDDDQLRPEAWAQARRCLDRLRAADGEVSFAVRSSALSEDSGHASFAGEFETVLDMHSDEMIREAVRQVRHSRHSERVRSYSEAKGIDTSHDMAIVVQRLIRADVSGVLFTVDPITGSHSQMLGNYVYGFGEELVSGEAEPYTFALQRPGGSYQGPADLRNVASRLYEMASRLETDLGHPQDIEWCIHDGELYLLQSRPITTLAVHDPENGAWNATLTGDYLWTNAMSAEIFPLAMKPSTWSLWQIVFNRLAIDDQNPTFGCIAGRPYLNYSLMYSFLMAMMRDHDKVMAMLESTVAVPPKGTEIPRMPVPLAALLLTAVPREIKTALAKRKLKKNLAELLSSLPVRCRELRRRIAETRDKLALVSIWTEEIRPLFLDVFTLQDAYNEDLAMQSRAARKSFVGLLGEQDSDHLLASVSSGSDQLASVGPVLALSRVASGQTSHQEYMERYGHRGPYENYLSRPRPYEDPDWLDRHLEELSQDKVNVESLLERRNTEFQALWDERASRLGPKDQRDAKRRLDRIESTCLAREATRSELTRVVGVVRSLFLRAGELTGLGEDAFALTIDELIDMLSGKDVPTARVPARQRNHERCSALPVLPAWIRGAFDPFRWAADPSRRTDLFDEHAAPPLSAGDVVQGNPGSAGRVEGRVRRIDNPDDRHRLRRGEILVTGTTNVGWTPLFPRAAAVVTDIGGALSHAAIVARELGIPAVVGCGDATMRLHTGDSVLVDGGRGLVTILERSAEIEEQQAIA